MFRRESNWPHAGKGGRVKVSDNSIQQGAGGPGQSGSPGHSGSGKQHRPRRKRRIKRIALLSAAGLMGLIVAVGGGAYLFANHTLSGVHRISVPALTAPGQPVMPPATRSSTTILLTSDAVGAAQQGAVLSSSVGLA